MNLYLVRHCESMGNADKSVYYQMPDWKIPLTEKGRLDAIKVGEKLKPLRNPYLFHSPYVRAKETAQIIQNILNTKPILREYVLLHEREWGTLREECNQFETREERSHLFDFFRRPEGGESFADVYKRASTFFEYLKKGDFEYKDGHHTEKNIIVVSHGEFLKVLLMIVDGDSVEEFENLPNIKNGQIIERRIYG